MGDGTGHIATDEISVLRDVQMAQEIRSLAALGVFPKGILVYGLVYYQNGERQYMISAEPEKLIAFLNDVENRKFFPTPIESYAESLIIPEGEEERIVQKVKLKLARNLQELYPAEVFSILEQLHHAVQSTYLDDALLTYREELESVFDIDKIKAFRDLCTRAYLRNIVSEWKYRSLVAWCEKRLAQLADDIPPMGKKEKRFYGMAVLEHQRISRSIINANLSCIYQEKCKLEQAGQSVTAWHEKWICVEQQESLRTANQEMIAFLQHIYDEPMLQLIERLESAPSGIDADTMQEAMARLSVYGAKAEALGRYYGQMWGAIHFAEEDKHAESK